MRELNPRAWIPSLNRYATGYDDIYYHRRINGEGEWWCYPAGKIIQLDVEIELPTDLKDKNGKEIYEGDIVASSYFGMDRVLKVVFYEGCFCLCETRLEIPQVGGVYYFRQGSRFRPQDDYEVVGNIHENHELLEEKE